MLLALVQTLAEALSNLQKSLKLLLICFALSLFYFVL